MQFQNSYASYYDLLYQDKDYAAECRYLLGVLKKHSQEKKLHNILDIACGTGSHAAYLAKQGLQIVGSDASKNMIAVARTKKASGSNPRYLNKDMRKLGAVGQFDAVICMFASLNYITRYDELEQVLNGVKANLKPGGLFFCDVWNGLAVLLQRPSNRVKYMKHKGIFLIRSSEPTLVPTKHLCYVNFRMTIFKKGWAEPLTYNEIHKTRFYFPEELKYIFGKNNLEVLDMHPFMNPRKRISDSDWNISIIARKI